MLPPMGMLDNPMNAVTTRFVRMSTNKFKCPIHVVRVSPIPRKLSYTIRAYSWVVSVMIASWPSSCYLKHLIFSLFLSVIIPYSKSRKFLFLAEAAERPYIGNAELETRGALGPKLATHPTGCPHGAGEFRTPIAWGTRHLDTSPLTHYQYIL